MKNHCNIFYYNLGNSTRTSGNGQNLFWALSRRLPDAMITAWKFSKLDVDRDSLIVNDELFSSRMKKTFGQIRRGRKCSKKLADSCDLDRNGGLSLDEWRRCLSRRYPPRGMVSRIVFCSCKVTVDSLDFVKLSLV